MSEAGLWSYYPDGSPVYSLVGGMVEVAAAAG